MAKRELIRSPRQAIRASRREGQFGEEQVASPLGIAASMQACAENGNETVAIVGRQRSRTHRHTIGVAV
jgi:hypothetical protein